MKNRLRSIVVLVGLILGVIFSVAPAVDAAPSDEFVIDGVGNGHGRGMSQWGAYGRALAGQPWTQILDSYYGGTTNGTKTGNIDVRITGQDGYGTVGVISVGKQALWAGRSYGGLYAKTVGSNRYEIYGSSQAQCPPSAQPTFPSSDVQYGNNSAAVKQLQEFLNFLGHEAGPVDGIFGIRTRTAVTRFEDANRLTRNGKWGADDRRAAPLALNNHHDASFTRLATVNGPVTFATSVNQSTAAPDAVLGLCSSAGSVKHYRGAIEVHHTSDGNRVVNEVEIENYLRSVISKEVSPSWGYSGDIAGDGQREGMHALRAQAVAARSYGLSQKRYPYAATCDTTSCQVYAGSAVRYSANTEATSNEHSNTDRAVKDTAGVVRVWPNGAIAATEFSASNGPRTAGGVFPAVDDLPFDNHPLNPLHKWKRTITASQIDARYGAGAANGARTERDPASPYEGIWSHRVVLGNGKTVSAWDFRNAFGFPSPGFTLTPATRPIGPLKPTEILRVPVLGRFGVPAKVDAVDAVLLNVTAVDGAAPGWVRVWDCASQQPSTSSVNHLVAAPAPNAVVVPLAPDSDGEICMRAKSTVNLVVDIAGWLSSGAESATGRILDTRTNRTTLKPGTVRRVDVTGQYGVPKNTSANSPVDGIILNVTAVNATNYGWLRVWDCAVAEPDTSAVNYPPWHPAPNAMVVPLAAGSNEVCIRTLATTDIVVDLAGWLSSGVETANGRVYDTRVTGDRLADNGVLKVSVLGSAGVPADASNLDAVALNVTATQARNPGWLRVWDCAAAEPGTSTVNYMAHDPIPNAVIVPLAPGSAGDVCIRTKVAVEVIVDVNGWLSAGAEPAAGRLLDMRIERAVVSPR